MILIQLLKRLWRCSIKLYHVVAMAKNGVIGKNNQLPWHFSSDMKHFKNLTTGSTIMMGRKTFESLGKPLPNRINFVLSKSTIHKTDGTYWFDNIDKALQQVSTENCYIIGGAQLFEQTIERVHSIYLTKIDQTYEGDSFYPKIPNCFKIETQYRLQENPILEVFVYKNLHFLETT